MITVMVKNKVTEFKNQVDNIKVDRPPFLEESVICGINSLIEVLELPHSKIKSINSDLIGIKLLEISKGKKFRSTVIYQSFLLQYLILKLCPDDRSLEMVLNLAMEKYQHFLKTGKIT